MQSLCDKWLSGFYGKLSFEDYALLDRAARTLEANSYGLKEGVNLPWSPRRGITPSIVGFKGVWNWDCAFHAMGCSRWDAALARDQVDIFIDMQMDSGGFPDVCREDGDLVDNFGKPPVFPWAAMIIEKREHNEEFLKRAYKSFVKNEEFWRRERGGDEHGMFFYDSSSRDEKRFKQACFESGWDNAVRWDNGIWNLWSIDLNCFMVMKYRALAEMAQILGLADESEVYAERGKTLGELVESKLWSEELGCYVDYDFENKCHSKVITPASFMPLFIGTASKERAAKMAEIAEKHLSPGWPSVAYDDPQYHPTEYWRGRTWYNIAFFALKGLKDYGYGDLAEEGKKTLFEWASRDPGCLYENYNSQTGNPVGVPHFGWTAAFIIEFILGWDD